MKKLTLDLETLAVESFSTAAEEPRRGTAFAHGAGGAGAQLSLDGCDGGEPVQHLHIWPKQQPLNTGYGQETCYGSCYFSCGCSLNGC